jgi:hypothetical protein
MAYRLFDRIVTAEFRDLVRRRYPGLDIHPVYWKIMQHCLFPNYCWQEGVGELLLTHEMMAEMVGSNRKNVCVQKWIEAFERDVGVPLNASGWSYSTGKARVIRPEIDPQILSVRDRELPREYRRIDGDRVDLITGELVNPRRRKEELKKHYDRLRAEAAAAGTQHPAKDLMWYLNEQCDRSLNYKLTANWDSVIRMADEMPQGPPRDSVFCILMVLAEKAVMVYRPVQNSARLFAEGLTVNGLPREMRKQALSGDVQIDLRCCQLAVVAKLWEVTRLWAMLESGQSFWSYILAEIGLPASYKSVVKPAIYSVLFGKRKKNLLQWLKERMPEQAADLFMNNEIVQSLLEARAGAYDEIGEHGGGYDAFGDWLPLTADRKPRQLFCAIVQSYELKLMAAMLPVLLAHKKELTLHSFLHDGASICCRRESEEETLVDQIAAAINAEARALGIPTDLEISR